MRRIDPVSAPIIPGFFPDPSVCAVEDRFIVVNSSFEYLPGIPVHVSQDLVSWEQVGNVVERRSQLDLSAAPSNGGVYAATIRHHEGRYFVVTTDIGTVREGQLIFTAPSPEGPWSDPVRVPGTVGIDPDLFWDRDGTCYLSWKRTFATEPDAIVSVPIDPATGQLLGPIRPLWQGVEGLASAEGPHLYLHDGHYYCLIAQGGTERGHGVYIARAPRIEGPWEPCPSNPILSHRSTDLPVQNTGHADLVHRPNGSWAAVYLGVRPRGMVPKYHVNGRETFVAEIEWVDGWPQFESAPLGEPMSTAFHDCFTSASLDARWISPGGHILTDVVFDDAPGVLVRASADDDCRPSLCARTRDDAWMAEVEFEGATDAAFQLRIDDANWVEIRRFTDRLEVHRRIAGRTFLSGSAQLSKPVSILCIEAAPWRPEHGLNAGPDRIVLSARSSTETIDLGDFDGRLLSTEVAGGFLGRTFGVRALTDPLRVAAIRYLPTV